MALLGPLFIPVLAILVSAGLSLMFLNKSQRDAILSYFHSSFLFNWSQQSRRLRESLGSSRSLPLKKQHNSTGPGKSADYKYVFPPSTRPYLRLAAPENDKLKADLVSSWDMQQKIIPFESDYRNCGSPAYTAMGISVGEIKALGDFPNYSTLCGVPMPEPYKDFKIESALPRPYRPFRWAYHQTMSLSKMETNFWLEVDKSYAETIRLRCELFEKHGDMVLNALPGSELATKELMEMVLQFYCTRYPQHFTLIKDHRGYVFKNGILKNETVIKDHTPLQILLHNVPEDFAVMLRNPEDGYYYLRSGMICSALGWNLESKMGLQLKEIHGPIPDYKEKMEFSMDRYFSKMPPGKPIQRGSWGLEVDSPLFMPPGDPHEKYRDFQDPDMTLSRLHLRVDWQTLRRLPLSGAIIFNFKGLFTPVTEFRDEPYIPALVRKILLNGKKNMMDYKNTWHVEHVALPIFKQWEREQVEKGLVEKDWEPATLSDSPWFPGWEAKWRRQQGF